MIEIDIDFNSYFYFTQQISEKKGIMRGSISNKYYIIFISFIHSFIVLFFLVFGLISNLMNYI